MTAFWLHLRCQSSGVHCRKPRKRVTQVFLSSWTKRMLNSSEIHCRKALSAKQRKIKTDFKAQWTKLLQCIINFNLHLRSPFRSLWLSNHRRSTSHEPKPDHCARLRTKGRWSLRLALTDCSAKIRNCLTKICWAESEQNSKLTSSNGLRRRQSYACPFPENSTSFDHLVKNFFLSVRRVCHVLCGHLRIRALVKCIWVSQTIFVHFGILKGDTGFTKKGR